MSEVALCLVHKGDTFAEKKAEYLASFNKEVYMDASLTRKRTPLGPYRRPMPRVLGGS